MADLGPTYTNAIQLRDRFKVLKDRQELKFAALDCWKTVAELLPDGVTLEGYNFSDGKKLTLSGSAPADQVKRLLDFDADIRKAAVNGQPLFDPNAGDHVTYRSAAGRHGELELRPRAQTVGGAMTNPLDRLNLRPFEKRLVVGGRGGVLCRAQRLVRLSPFLGFGPGARPAGRRAEEARALAGRNQPGAGLSAGRSGSWKAKASPCRRKISRTSSRAPSRCSRRRAA